MRFVIPRWLLAVPLLAGACSSGVAITVDGVEISDQTFDGLHKNVADLDDDDLAGSALLLVLQEALTARAGEDLDVTLEEEEVEVAFQSRIERIEGIGVEEVLSNRNETLARMRIESELDVISNAVGASLVLNEGGNFDLARAFEEYSVENAEVCLRQITLATAEDFQTASDRLADGEEFAAVARDISVDPFVDRTEGVGAGGELGCSAPFALPEGLGVATLTATVNEVSGPVASSAGLHLFVVYDRSVEALDEVKPAVLEHAIPRQGPNLFREWAIAVLIDADVHVDSRYGTWGVIPETDPSPTVVPRYRTNAIISE